MDALQQATIRVAAVIAEGVPERDTKKLIAFARANNKVLIGPATVGGIQVSCKLAKDVHLPLAQLTVHAAPAVKHATVVHACLENQSSFHDHAGRCIQDWRHCWHP